MHFCYYSAARQLPSRSAIRMIAGQVSFVASDPSGTEMSPNPWFRVTCIQPTDVMLKDEHYCHHCQSGSYNVLLSAESDLLVVSISCRQMKCKPFGPQRALAPVTWFLSYILITTVLATFTGAPGTPGTRASVTKELGS